MNSTPQSKFASLSILVADDHEASRMLAKTFLHHKGHNVSLTHDGRDAVNAAMTQQFDVIFMDIQMPVMDGIEAAKSIRMRPGLNMNTPIYAMTIQTTNSDIAAYRAAGMKGLLPKPITARDISTILASVTKRAAAPSVTKPPKPVHIKTPINSLIDPHRLSAIFAGSTHSTAEQILTVLTRDITNTLSSISAACEVPTEHTQAECARLAHGLKGTSANYGAIALQEAARLFGAMSTEEQCQSAPYLNRMASQSLADLSAYVRTALMSENTLRYSA